MTTAHQLASTLLELLQPACEDITVAGSIRRGRPTPHDIEIVLSPIPLTFDHHLHSLEAAGVLLPDTTHQRDGHRYKRRLYDGFPVDLFIVEPPAQWGLIVLIRTGCADFSQAVLSRWKKVTNGGFSKDGCLYNRNGVRHPTPTEDDVFMACDLPWIPPDERHPAGAINVSRLGPGPTTNNTWHRSQVTAP